MSPPLSLSLQLEYYGNRHQKWTLPDATAMKHNTYCAVYMTIQRVLDAMADSKEQQGADDGREQGLLQHQAVILARKSVCSLDSLVFLRLCLDHT